MSEQNSAASASVNRAKPYQLMLFPLNNGATNVYYVLVLSYIATFGSKVLALSMIFASVMVTGMRLFDAITDPIIGALMDRTNGKFGKFRPFMVIGNLIMAASILVLYCLTPLIPATMMWVRYAVFVALYAVWVIGYTFQTSCTRSGQTVLTNDPKQRPMFASFDGVYNTLVFAILGIIIPRIANSYNDVGGYASLEFFDTLWKMTAVMSAIFTTIAVISIAPKDRSEFFGTGKPVKVGLKDYWDTLKNNRAIQMLVLSASTDKLFMSTMSNSTVMICLFGIIFGMIAGIMVFISLDELLPAAEEYGKHHHAIHDDRHLWRYHRFYHHHPVPGLCEPQGRCFQVCDPRIPYHPSRHLGHPVHRLECSGPDLHPAGHRMARCAGSVLLYRYHHDR